MKYSINVVNVEVMAVVGSHTETLQGAFPGTTQMCVFVPFIYTGSYILLLCLSCFSLAACSIRPGPASQILTMSLWQHQDRQK